MLLPLALLTILIIAAAFTRTDEMSKTSVAPISCSKEMPKKACVFKTLIGMESFDTSTVIFNTGLTDRAIKSGLQWILKAQQADGGWGAGSHQHQDVINPHAVPADPASTALVAMALLRIDEKPFEGAQAAVLNKAINYLLTAVDRSPQQSINITTLTNTQPQTKLGRNIDVILTAQFFSNALHKLGNKNASLRKQLETALQKCTGKIQRAQAADGSFKDGGWAPVLQSALANNALESAGDAGAKVDSTVLRKSRDYQKNNFNEKTNSASTGEAAGVLLYSISGTARASAKEAREAGERIDKAKKEGKLNDKAQVTEDNLVVAGYSRSEAKKLATAYKLQGAAAMRAQDDDVVSGFGSNGGEEFLSYLMTGESLVIGGGNQWKNWYEKMSGRLAQIQNEDGSWNGHHCITSPVFCTATCLLILSVNKDIDFLIKTK